MLKDIKDIQTSKKVNDKHRKNWKHHSHFLESAIQRYLKTKQFQWAVQSGLKDRKNRETVQLIKMLKLCNLQSFYV